MARGTAKNGDLNNDQVSVTEAPGNTQEEYLQLNFISSLQSERVIVFEASLRRSNAVVQM